MIERLGAILFLALGLAAPAAGQTPDRGHTEDPVWLSTPDSSLIRQLYPAAAASQYVEGRATLECIVMLVTTTRCEVSAESPQGWGFGGAALRIAEGFRVRPAVVNGVPVEGGRIRRSIRFVMPDEDVPEKDPLSELEAFFSQGPRGDLPHWDEAPNFYASLDAYPPEARRARVAGRGVLACRVKENRRLTCELVTEVPAGMGFGQAALALQDAFLVSERDVEFAARHRETPFLLPITFSEVFEAMPVNRMLTGIGPLSFSTMRAPLRDYPEAARAARVEGEAVVLCTARIGPQPDCVIESETPPGWGFGASLLEVFSSFPFTPDEGGWILEGDQVRFTAEFRVQD